MPRTSIQDFLIEILSLLNTTIIPLIFAAAIFFFIFNAARYFVFSGSNEAGQDSAKRLALYGIAALVVMLSLWGIVRMATGAFGINRSIPVCPDFNPNCFGTGSGNVRSGGINGRAGEKFFDISNPTAGVRTDTKGTLQY